MVPNAIMIPGFTASSGAEVSGAVAVSGQGWSVVNSATTRAMTMITVNTEKAEMCSSCEASRRRQQRRRREDEDKEDEDEDEDEEGGGI